MHAAVGRTVTTGWGQAHLLPALHRVYDLNFLWVADDAGDLDAERLDAEADRLLGGAGLTHRRLLLEAGADARLGSRLAALGYTVTHHRCLAFAGPPPAPPPAEVHVGDVGTILAALDRYLRTDTETTYGYDEITRRQLLEHARLYGSALARERCFAIRDDDGQVVAWAKLWTLDGVAQVEDVVCLREFRGRGFGRDVVAAATRAALAEAHDLVFIVADADDWPKDLYARLGYEPVGDVGLYLRQAPGAAYG